MRKNIVIKMIVCLIPLALLNCKEIPSNKIQMTAGELVFANSGELIKVDVSSKKSKKIYTRDRNTYKYALYPIWNNHGYISALRESIVDKDYIVLINNEGKIGNELIKLPGKECTMPAISPNNKKIAFLCGEYKKAIDKIDYRLYIASINGKQIKKYSYSCSYNQPSWSTDGTKIAITSPDNVIYSLDIVTGTRVKITNGVAPSYSPDGNYLAYFQPRSNSRHSDLNLLSFSTQKSKTLIADSSFGTPIENTPQWSFDCKYLFYVKFSPVLLPPERLFVNCHDIVHKNNGHDIVQSKH